MTGLFKKSRPPFGRVLLIESGSRQAADRFLQYLYQFENCAQVDVLTCFSTPPEAFQSQRGRMFLVTDPAIAEHRRQFVRTIASAPYDVVAVLRTGSGILRKWKWLIALLTRAKVLVVREGADFIFLDYGYLETIKINLPRFRREQVARLRLAGETLLMPFTILFLLLYAGQVHLRRLLRNGARIFS
jgi:hypothetical protein